MCDVRARRWRRWNPALGVRWTPRKDVPLPLLSLFLLVLRPIYGVLYFIRGSTTNHGTQCSVHSSRGPCAPFLRFVVQGPLAFACLVSCRAPFWSFRRSEAARACSNSTQLQSANQFFLHSIRREHLAAFDKDKKSARVEEAVLT